MEIGTSFLSYIFVDSGSWRLSYENFQFKAYMEGNVYSFDLQQVKSVKVAPGFIWASIQIETTDRLFRLKGAFNSQSEQLAALVKADMEYIHGKALSDQLKTTLKPLMGQLHRFMGQDAYLSHSLLSSFKKSLPEDTASNIDKLNQLSRLDAIFAIEPTYQELLTQLQYFVETPLVTSTQVIDRNHAFVKSELTRFKDFFDQVESTPLTEEQRRSCVIFEDRNLLIAAAGSGKTSTIVGKAGYALLKGIYQPEEILVLAYNKNAAEELKERISGRLKDILKPGQQIEAQTFHKLGMQIIAEATQKKPSISNEANDLSRTISKVIQSLLVQDAVFQAKMLLFRTAYLSPTVSPFDYKSAPEWDNAYRQSWDRFKEGYTIYQGEVVKSHGEKAIANWLYRHGIPYAYERSYPHDTASQQYRQYRPDFYLPEIDLYLEHYALDAKNQPPAHFGQRYLEQIAWQKETHKKYGTNLITTTFAEFISGQIFAKLEKELKKRGQVFKPKTLEEMNSQAERIYEAKPDPLFSTFLSHYKSNQYSISKLLSQPGLTLRQKLFLELFETINEKYEQQLKAQNEIDFEDLILQSAALVRSNKYQSPYKLIIVDEFQDISQARARLVLALLQQRPEAKLFCVGDDWQAIYRFAGSDISVFTHFERFFGFSKKQYLTKTFRSNQGIANAASVFIQKNPSQLKKQVTAIDKNTDKVVEVSYCKNAKEQNDALAKILLSINEQAQGKKLSVFILGRYRHLNPDFLNTLSPLLPQCSVTFKTMHASKGLQADMVIVLGLNKGRYAFPSEMEDDPLLDMVLPEPESHAHSEERRLLYVALTRAKQKVYLLGERQSVFLHELVNEPSLKNIIHCLENEQATANPSIPAEWLCPQCNQGRLWKREGKFGPFLGCSRYPECRYTKKLKGKPVN